MTEKFNYPTPGGEGSFEGEEFNSKLKELENELEDLYKQEEKVLDSIRILLEKYEDKNESVVPEGLDDLEAECGLIGLRIKEIRKELKIGDN